MQNNVHVLKKIKEVNLKKAKKESDYLIDKIFSPSEREIYQRIQQTSTTLGKI